MSELKPCPFCGRIPYRMPMTMVTSLPVYIACMNEGCDVKPKTYSVDSSSEDQVWDAWNKRSEAKQ